MSWEVLVVIIYLLLFLLLLITVIKGEGNGGPFTSRQRQPTRLGGAGCREPPPPRGSPPALQGCSYPPGDVLVCKGAAIVNKSKG